MKYLHLVFHNLGRRKVRTAFTLLTIFISFLLFGLLVAVRTAFSQGAEAAELDRLIVINKISLIQPLPVKYGAADRRHPGRREDHPSELVRRLLPGPEEPVRRSSRSTPSPSSRSTTRSCSPTRRRRTGSPTAPAPSSAARRPRSTAGRWATASRSRPRSCSAGMARAPGSSRSTASSTRPTRAATPAGFYFHYEYLKEAPVGFGGGEWNLVGMYEMRIADAGQASGHLRRDRPPLRELRVRDQDHDREGVRAVVRQPDRQRRRDRDRNRRGGLLHAAAGGRQHHGPGGARADRRARGAQDARVHRCEVLAPGARRSRS